VADHELLELRDLHKSYGQGELAQEVLHGIDLRIDRGEFTAITGPSGSGKSTLLHLIGLLDRPTSGSIFLRGRDARSLTDAERTDFRGRTLGFVFQFHYLLNAFSAIENVMMPMMAIQGREEPWMRERARELLDGVGLSEKVDSRASNLSGGQQQRVAIARALAMDGQLVLADEPTGNLDTESGEQVFTLLRRFNRDRRTAFVIVTHDHRIANQCDRVIVLVDGRIIADNRFV
jgi:lipoprotein-releasing system ATP-binding protein